MVLICGVTADIKKLPYAGAIEYVVKARTIDIKMLAKTKMLQQATEIYATIEAVDYIASQYRSKTFLVKDEKDLIEKLYGQPQSDYMAQVAENTVSNDVDNADNKRNKNTKLQSSNKTKVKSTDNDTEVQKTSTTGMTYSDGTPVQDSDSADTFVITDNDYEQLLEEKDREIQTRDTTILSLKDLIKAKDAMLEELTTELTTYSAADLESKLSALEKQLAEKEAEIEELHAAGTSANQQQVQELIAEREMCATALTEKETDITLLKNRIADLENQLTQVMQDNATTENTTVNLNVQIESLRNKLTETEQLLQDKTKETERQQVRIDELTEQNARVTELEYAIQVSNETISTKDTEIQALNAKLKAERVQFEQDKEAYTQMLEEYENNNKCNKIADMLSPHLYYTAKKPEVPRFTSTELKTIASLNLKNISLVSFAGGNTQHAGLCGIQKMLASGDDIVLVDLTGDAWLPSILGLERMATLNNMTKDNIADIVIKKGTIDIIRTRAFNDIQLLDYDWVSILTKLCDFVGERRTYILLSGIRSFAVKYTVMKLMQILATTILVKAEPYVVQNLFWELLGIPANSITLGVFDYVPIVKQMLDKFVNQYRIKVTKGNDVVSVIAHSADNAVG